VAACAQLRFIQPGKPEQNEFIERFNETYRDDVLDACVVGSLDRVQDITESWLRKYNEEWPHDSFGWVPPLMFLPKPQRPAESSYELCA